MNITILTFGSRGDVQPFLALAVALRERGHDVTLIAPNDIETHFQAYQIPYKLIPLSARDLDIAERITREGLTPANLLRLWREAIPKMKNALYEAAHIAAAASRGADLLIAHGFLVSFAYSIHQHLKIPLMLGIAAPIIATQAFPMMFPPIPFGQRFYNPLTYHALVRMVTSFMIEPMNRYRQDVGLPKLSMGKLLHVLFSGEIPIVMHYSRYLLPVMPPDWGANVHVVGAWRLPTHREWTPPNDLSTFLAAGEAPVYIGFGSMPVGKTAQKAQIISDALRLAGLRGVLQAGWSKLAHEDEHLINIDDAPHDWLFPRMAAIVHHGGSGTTHSALSAGKPALIVPFSADQPYWGWRIADLGVGVPPIKPQKLTPERLATALRTLTQDNAMRQRAAELGEMLRAEDGLASTCALVERM